MASELPVFFTSYDHSDRVWTEWIAETIEPDGYEDLRAQKSLDFPSAMDQHTVIAQDVLVVFVGHSDDASEEAKVICDLRSDLQKELDSRLEVMDAEPPFKKVKVWEWRDDAKPIIGGQDYLGIASWINGTWKIAKDRSTQAYIQKVRAIQADGKLKITFTKVKAHSGILFNEIADCLAQTAAREQLATSF
jgi:hypothetical protein